MFAINLRFLPNRNIPGYTSCSVTLSVIVLSVLTIRAMGVALDRKDVRLVKTINQFRDVSFELKQTQAELSKCQADSARELQLTKDALDKCKEELARACKTSTCFTKNIK